MHLTQRNKSKKGKPKLTFFFLRYINPPKFLHKQGIHVTLDTDQAETYAENTAFVYLGEYILTGFGMFF